MTQPQKKLTYLDIDEDAAENMEYLEPVDYVEPPYDRWDFVDLHTISTVLSKVQAFIRDNEGNLIDDIPYPVEAITFTGPTYLCFDALTQDNRIFRYTLHIEDYIGSLYEPPSYEEYVTCERIS